MSKGFPRPSTRINNILGRANERHPHVSMYTTTSSAQGVPISPQFKVWRVDIRLDFSHSTPMDLGTLYEGNDEVAVALRARILERKSKKNLIRPNEAMNEVIEEIHRQPWEWKLMGIRGSDLLKPENKLTRMFKPDNLNAGDLPDVAQIMLFFAEERAREAWELTLLARNL